MPSRGEQHPHRFPVTASARRREMLAHERSTSGRYRIEVIGLGPVPTSRTRWTVDPDNPFTAFEQMGGQSRSEAAGALDSPDPPASGIRAGEGVELAESECVGGYGESLNESAGSGENCGRCRSRGGCQRRW